MKNAVEARNTSTGGGRGEEAKTDNAKQERKIKGV